MKIFFFCTFWLIHLMAFAQQAELRHTRLFDDDWRFHRGGALGAENPDFPDSTWRTIDLPHDWSIEDLPGTDSPFDSTAISQVNGGFTTGGTGWYRKHFSMDAGQQGKRIHLQFDGVYMNAEVWINGEKLGNHPYGYTSFWFDITDQLRYDSDNVLAVRVKNEGQNSRWYSGSGIYRHVWLKTVEPLHITQWGTYITTPEVSTTAASVRARTKVLNQQEEPLEIRLISRILDSEGAEVTSMESSQHIGAGEYHEFDQQDNLSSPALWSVDTPNLYSLVQELYYGDQLSDRQETSFGIRSISFDTAQGFLLNGEPLLLKGGCIHHDNGPLGARAYDRAEERRVELLKASGYNAIRSAHNPPSPAFLDACDRLGMLVIDEAFDMWNEPKNAYDYHLYFDKWWREDVESMLLRDRNHPSIIMWSIGNEIPNMDKPEVVALARQLGDFIREKEPTRPITAGVNGLRPDKDPFFATLDLAGYNYPVAGDHGKSNLYQLDHERVPERIVYCSESYPIAAFGSWMGVVDNPWVFGDFVWTAFDYLGEASIGWLGYWQKQSFYPWNLAFCGDIDICGWKRPQSYYRDALWMEDQLSLFVTPPQPSFERNPDKESWSLWDWRDEVADWNWDGHEGSPLEVSVYSSCEEVELFLNDQSLGRKPTNRTTEYTARWEVPYEPGSLRTVGYHGNKEVNRAEIRTASAPHQLQLSADRTSLRADGQDLSYITVELLDAGGARHPKAEELVEFELEGPGSIVAVGNANPISTESYQLPQRTSWQGRCLVIVKAGKEAGDIVLRARAPGLQPAEIRLSSQGE